MSSMGKELDPDAVVGLQPLSDLLVELPLPAAWSGTALTNSSSISLTPAQRESVRSRIEQNPALEHEILQRFHASGSTTDSLQLVINNNSAFRNHTPQQYNSPPSRLFLVATGAAVPRLQPQQPARQPIPAVIPQPTIPSVPTVNQLSHHNNLQNNQQNNNYDPHLLQPTVDLSIDLSQISQYLGPGGLSQAEAALLSSPPPVAQSNGYNNSLMQQEIYSAKDLINTAQQQQQQSFQDSHPQYKEPSHHHRSREHKSRELPPPLPSQQKTPKTKDKHHHSSHSSSHHRDHHHTKHKSSSSSNNRLKHDQNAKLEDVLEELTGAAGSATDGTDMIEIDIGTLKWLVQKTAKMKNASSKSKVDGQKLQFLLTALTQLLTLKTSALKQDLTARAKATRKQSIAANQRSDDEDEDDDLVDEETLEEEFDTCCDCCLTALQVMTTSHTGSSNDRKLLVEDTLEQILLFYNSSLSELTSIRAPVAGAAAESTPGRGRGRSPTKKGKAASGCLIGVSRGFLIRCAAKWSQLLELLALLLKGHPGALTDTLVLSLTRGALTSFVLDTSRVPTSELQLGALQVLRLIFLQYPSHQTVILEELLNAIPRLDLKRGSTSINGFKLSSSGTSISLFAALLMQLVTSLAPPLTSASLNSAKSKHDSANPTSKMNGSLESSGGGKELTTTRLMKHLRSCHESAAKVAYGFVQSLMNKCNSGNSADEFRAFLDMLVGDLLTSLHRPQLPSSVLLLQAVIRQLVCNISGKASQGLKLQSLELLGNIACEFAKVFSGLEKSQDEASDALQRLANPKDEEGGDTKQAVRQSIRAKEKREASETPEERAKRIETERKRLTMEYWTALLAYYDQEEMGEEKFYLLASWMKEVGLVGQRTKRLQEQALLEEVERVTKPVLNLVIETDGRGSRVGGEDEVVDRRVARSLIRLLDCDLSLSSKLLYESSLKCLVIALGNAHNTNVRSRAMKSLAMVLNDSPQRYAAALLQREDLQHALSSALTDASTSVRESTIDLIGRFVLNSKDDKLLDKYYDVITARILDSGVSVRKRVIKVLREVCATVFPSHPKVPEICSKLIRRISDDGEGIRKLVSETFTALWFTPEKDTDSVRNRVNCLIHVVGTVIREGMGLDFLQTLINNLSKGNMSGSTNASGGDCTSNAPDNPDSTHTTAKTKREEAERIEVRQRFNQSSAQLIGIIIKEILCGTTPVSNNVGESSSEPNPDNPSASSSTPKQEESKIDITKAEPDPRKRSLYAMTSLLIFARSEPTLLVDHFEVLEPFLSHATTRISSQLDLMVLKAAVELFELVIPLMKAPSATLCARMEESLVKHVLGNGATVMAVCVSCLSKLVKHHTLNWQLVRDTFGRFYNGFLVPIRQQPIDQLTPKQRCALLRALYGVGLFMKHFKPDDMGTDEKQVYRTFVYFANCLQSIPPKILSSSMQSEQDWHYIREKAVEGLGFMFESHPDLMLEKPSEQLYKQALLSGSRLPPPPARTTQLPAQFEILERRRCLHEKLACYVLNNLKSYLSDEAASEAEQRIDWKKEDLKSMSTQGEDGGSTLSLVVQRYLEDILSCTTSARPTIRRAAVALIQGVHASGNVHPIQIIPCLIGMSSDDEANIRIKADSILQELKGKYPITYINMKSRQGILEAFKLHYASGRRGWRLERVASVQSGGAEQGDSGESSGSSKAEILITARLATLYSMLATNRANRRALINLLLKYFDPDPLVARHRREREIGNLSLDAIRVFVCDNLAWLPYGVWDEPLFLLGQLEVTLSLIATQVFDYFKELLRISNEEDLDALDPELAPEDFIQLITNLPSVAAAQKREAKQLKAAQHNPQLPHNMMNGPSNVVLPGMNDPNHLYGSLPNGQMTNDSSSLMSIHSSLSTHSHSSQDTVMNLNSHDDLSQQFNTSSSLPPNEVNMTNGPTSNPSATVSTPQQSIVEYFNTFDPSDPHTKELLESVIDGLKAWHQVAWLRLLLRELFSVTDVKVSEYTPADNTKAYEKPVHRKNIDASSLDYVMRYPKPELEKKLKSDKARIIRENGELSQDSGDEDQPRVTYLDVVQEFSNFRHTAISGFEKPPAVLIREWAIKAAKMEAERESRERREKRARKDEELKQRCLTKNNLSECVVMLDDITDFKDILGPGSESDLGFGSLAPSREALSLLADTEQIHMNMEVNFRRQSSETDDSTYGTMTPKKEPTPQMQTPPHLLQKQEYPDEFKTPTQPPSKSKREAPDMMDVTPKAGPLKITLKRKRGDNEEGDGWASGSNTSTPAAVNNRNNASNSNSTKKQKTKPARPTDGTGWGSDASESDSEDGSGESGSDSESEGGSDSGSDSGSGDSDSASESEDSGSESD